MKKMVFDNLTVLIPTHNRINFFLEYLESGKWDGVRIYLVCDGCSDEVIERLNVETKIYKNVTIFNEQPNCGVAGAIRKGLQKVNTDYCMFCGDDDYYMDYYEFIKEAFSIIKNFDDVLFVSMPEIIAFNEISEYIQYNRRMFHGMTGMQLLEYIVHTGEIHALIAGSIFKKDDIISILPDSFFKVSEDYVLLARLCASFPYRKIYVAKSGRKMRRIHKKSLSHPSQFGTDKMLIHIVSIVVGGYYLEKIGRINRAEFIRILLNRGKLLQRIYGFGLQTAALVGGLLLDRPPDPKAAEAVHALNYLRAHRDVLPPELMAMLSDAGKSMLMAS